MKYCANCDRLLEVGRMCPGCEAQELCKALKDMIRVAKREIKAGYGFFDAEVVHEYEKLIKNKE